MFRRAWELSGWHAVGGEKSEPGSRLSYLDMIIIYCDDRHDQ